MFGDLVKIKKGTSRRMDADENPTYDEWLKRVDRIISHCAAGLTSDVMMDQPYKRWYEERLRPCWAAKKAVANQFDYRH